MGKSILKVCLRTSGQAFSYFCSAHWFLGLLQESGMTIIAAEDLDDAALKAVEAIKS